MVFSILERSADQTAVSLEDVIRSLRWNGDGLIAAIAQQHDTGAVLMLAWMNEDALVETLATQRVCYWSRSRQQLWRKGETSGHRQHLLEARFDCDGDAILLLVDQVGPACHTGRPNCFYNVVHGREVRVTGNAGDFV